MAHHDKQFTDAEVVIDHSIWKSLLLGIVCLIFVTMGLFFISDVNSNGITKIIGGWLNVLFFGIGGLFYIVTVFYRKIHGIPFLVIYADKLDCCTSIGRKRHTIYFKDVERFRPIKVSASEQIAIDYKTTFIQNKFASARTSRITEYLLSFNYKQTGAIESIPADNLNIKGKEICDILNERVRRFADNKSVRE